MDKGSIGGVMLAISGILAGLWMEGGKISQILQPTAALIVFGGTMGAVLLQFPLSTVAAAFRSLAHVFVAPQRAERRTHAALDFLCEQGSPRRRGFARCRSDRDHGSISPAVADAGGGWHRTCGVAQNHARRSRLRIGTRRAPSPGVRVRRRLFAHHRHPRRGAWPDPGNAASR